MARTFLPEVGLPLICCCCNEPIAADSQHISEVGNGRVYHPACWDQYLGQVQSGEWSIRIDGTRRDLHID